MTEQAAFDVLAADYDTSFSQSLTGQAQRLVSRAWLQSFLAGKGRLRILEINCGTGEDAIWLASLGHMVIATDQSAHMIREARAKVAPDTSTGSPAFITCGFETLGSHFNDNKFDLVFSNFAGLNCISPVQLTTLHQQLQQLLTTDGCIAAVIFGKYCWWETCYYLLRADRRNAFRRWTSKPVMARLTDSVAQPVFYYSIRRFMKSMPLFYLVEKKPIGLFIPPSYMEYSMQKNKRLFGLLVKLEHLIQRVSFCSTLADHTYLLLKKQTR
ncbi:class I SAM-dependent methyltransferase [Paraflavitalea soli]|uniref:Class I SAM-dependent methyltransferase n=1 Tax=Paraflavitalea soli TaxID=2315862 RepID=A0A3B7MVK6_9BACT|nr:class I SAM-dependent methyltransferase [Paraflavitalea soli]AXY75685.1 class I SAM-dependent methyltransferase [Paraflavitalea soli]